VSPNFPPNCADPSIPYDCKEWCKDCNAGNSGNLANNDAQGINGLVNGATSVVGLLRLYIVRLRSTGICNSQCLSYISCATALLDFALSISNSGYSADTPADTVSSGLQVACDILNCASMIPAVNAIPAVSWFTMACSLGGWLAHNVLCNDYSITLPFLGGMTGLPRACQIALINAQPVTLEDCGTTITVAACTRDSLGRLIPRSYNDISRDCVSTVVNVNRVPRIPQLQLGRCAYKCIQLTMAASANCISPPPVQITPRGYSNSPGGGYSTTPNYVGGGGGGGSTVYPLYTQLVTAQKK